MNPAQRPGSAIGAAGKQFPFLPKIIVLLTLLIACGAPSGLHAEVRATDSQPTWTGDETLLLVGGLAGAGILSLYDEDLHDEAGEHRHSGLDRISDGFDLLGHPLVTLGIGGALYGAGMMRRDEELAQTGRLAVQAVLVAEAATLALKVGVGRERPDGDEDAWSFRPLALEDDHDSFPSAHTSGAFALASVLSQRSTRPYAPWLYYGLASLVGLSRVYDEDHWASDVAVGALVGELSGRLLVRMQGQKSGWLLGVAPSARGGSLVALSRRW